MKKIFVHLGKKWYLIVILAIAIILQCYCQLMLPEYMGNIQNQIRSVDVNFEEIWRYGGYMIGLSAAVVCLAFIQFYSASTVSAYVGQKLRTEMFKKVNSISLSDYNQFGTATLITRTTNDVEQIKNFTLMALRILVMSPTMMIIAIIKTAQERPSLLLVLGVILPIIIIFLLIILYVTAPYFKKIQEKIDNVTIVLRENLTGVRVVRAYDQEVVESKKFSKANKDLVQTTVKVNRIMSFTNPFINILFNLCFIGIYAFGFYLLSRITSDDTLKMYAEIGELVTDITVVAQYSSQIMMSFLMFAMIFIMMPQALASARRVNEVLNIDSNKDKNTIYKDHSKYNEYKAKIEELYKKEESLTKPLLEKYKKEFNKEFNISLLKYQLEISSKEEYKNNKELAYLLKYEKIHQEYHLKRKKIREAFKNHVSDGTDTSKENDLIAKSNINGVIEFKNVTFSYPDTDTPCIENISFKTKPGKTTAIIGSTGSGKSTIINLIPKFYKPTSGEILFDGVNLEDVPSECVREHLGFVPQTALLFKGTIRSNIQFGKKDATDEEIKEVLKVAQAKNFIDKLPDQLDTFVSQSGKNFSGGQKQRLCIARALVKKPEVYVFDDSFSALDFKTDAKLRNALKGYVGNSSIIVVAQRVSSILDADNIIVLHEGKIVDQGTHQELIARCNVYQDIVKSQLDSDEIEKTINLNKDYVLEGGE